MNTWNALLEMTSLHVGIGDDTVYFTEEETVAEALQNDSCVVAVTIDKHGIYKPWARLHLTKTRPADGHDFLINLEHYPEYYEKFTKWALKVVNEEGCE